MKRSEIQKVIEWAKDLLKEYQIALPEFAYWDYDEWKKRAGEIDVIKQTMLGWDITDYGSDDYEKTGAMLFTLRNGVLDHPEIGTPYAEKLILTYPGQRLPIHMHKGKSEDIISRAGGAYEIKLWNTGADGLPDKDSDVTLYSDGLKLVVKPGETLRIENGHSVTLAPYLYHTFWGAADAKPAIIGEVSSVNDDNTDNYFAEETKRFAAIEEDEPRRYVLCNEYDAL